MDKELKLHDHISKLAEKKQELDEAGFTPLVCALGVLAFASMAVVGVYEAAYTFGDHTETLWWQEGVNCPEGSTVTIDDVDKGVEDVYGEPKNITKIEYSCSAQLPESVSEIKCHINGTTYAIPGREQTINVKTTYDGDEDPTVTTHPGKSFVIHDADVLEVTIL